MNAQNGPGQWGLRGPAVLVKGGGVVGGDAEQVIERRQLHALVRDQKAQVFQVGIAVAHEHVEHQPAKQPRACHSRATAGPGQSRQAIHAALAVLEATIEAKQLASINGVTALPPLGAWHPVKTINQVHRRGHVASMHVGHIQAESLGQPHDKPFVDDGMRVVLVWVIRLEDVGGRRGTGRLKQCALLQDNGQLVLRPSQRHALDCCVRQWRLRHL